MIKHIRVNGTSHTGRFTRCMLHFDDKGHLTNPRALAASSMVGWGQWQTQEKVPCHWGACWYVTTAGHGGYILVSIVKFPFIDPVLTIEPYSVEHDPTYVYEFEEDCAWAILEYVDELVRRRSYNNYNKRMTELGKTWITEQEYFEDIKRCLASYFPQVLSAVG